MKNLNKGMNRDDFATAQQIAVSAFASPLWLDLTDRLQEALPVQLNVGCNREGTVKSVEAEQTEEDHQLFRLKGDCGIALSWHPSVKKGKPKTKSTKKQPVKDGQDSN